MLISGGRFNVEPPVRIGSNRWNPSIQSDFPEKDVLAKPNYQFDKRQRDLAKKKKQDEKRQRKQTKEPEAGDGVAPANPGDTPAG